MKAEQARAVVERLHISEAVQTAANAAPDLPEDVIGTLRRLLRDAPVEKAA